MRTTEPMAWYSWDSRSRLLKPTTRSSTRWPEDVLALKRLAAVLMELKEWKRARLISERLIRTSAGEVAGYTLAGIGFHVSRHAEEAAASFERVLQLDPDLKAMPLPQRLFWEHLALELIALGRTADARRHLERALGKQDDAGLRELLGMTYEKEGSLDDAERCWRQALTLDPNNADTLLDLGRLALGRRRFDEAVGLLERLSNFLRLRRSGLQPGPGVPPQGRPREGPALRDPGRPTPPLSSASRRDGRNAGRR